jgi:hypothetical protein
MARSMLSHIRSLLRLDFLRFSNEIRPVPNKFPETAWMSEFHLAQSNGGDYSGRHG